MKLVISVSKYVNVITSVVPYYIVKDTIYTQELAIINPFELKKTKMSKKSFVPGTDIPYEN